MALRGARAGVVDHLNASLAKIDKMLLLLLLPLSHVSSVFTGRRGSLRTVSQNADDHC